MYSLIQRVPKSFIENNDEWMQSTEPNSQMLRWNKKGSDLFAISTPTSNYYDIFAENEQPSRFPGSAFGFAQRPNSYDSYIPSVNELGSSNHMLSDLLSENAQLFKGIPDIRNYLSSAYVNPRLKNRLTNSAPFDRRKRFPRI
ncbi:MAG TPA: hypothetical protein VE572_03180 [Nitrososphaeraceae archaeon]|nr:hypothetical protein [Nitrososphaeraceae archaeon]